MKLENCNELKLQYALDYIKDINCSDIENLANKVLSDEWQSCSNKKISSALKSLASEYKEIKAKASKYQGAVSKLNQYKEISNEMDNINSKIYKYENKLKYCDVNDNDNIRYYKERLNYYKNKRYSNNRDLQSLSNSINQILN